MAKDRVVPLNLGVVPEAAVSGGLLLQSEYSAFFLFNAMRVESDGRRVEAGVAVVAFNGPLQTRFGHPNDEARAGHPVLGRPTDCHEVCEVLDSSWLAEVERQNQVSFPEFSYTGVRHFIVSLHDSTLECLARGMVLEACVDNYEAAVRLAAKQILSNREHR